MRDYDSPTAAYLGARAGTVIRILIWAEAKNRATGLVETLGLWTGAEDRVFTVDGVARTYFGAGTVMQVPPISYGTGLAVRMQRLTLSPLAPAVGDLIRTYDCRFAPLQIHRALFSTGDGALVAEPHRVYKGFIDEVQVITPEAGGEARCELTVASSARLLTRTLALKKSDATQQLRSGDRFRKYVDVSGSVDVWWGERRGGEAPSKPKKRGFFGRLFGR